MTSTTPTLRAYLRALSEELGQLSAAPEQEAQRWLCREYGWSRAQLFTRLNQAPPRALPAAIWQRRLAGEPEAYIHRQQSFYGLNLEVSPAVLIPRPDTETLVDMALERASALPQHAVVADLGTGSGAIALALASAQPHWHIIGIERSPEALELAQSNGRALGLKVDWRLGNWLEPLGDQHAHMIVSNPPYIAAGDPHLQALQHEPAPALIAADNGLADLQHILQNAPAYLHPQGHLLVEHGSDQGPAVRALFAHNGYQQIHSQTDLAGLERVSAGSRP